MGFRCKICDEPFEDFTTFEESRFTTKHHPMFRKLYDVRSHVWNHDPEPHCGLNKRTPENFIQEQ